MHSGRIGALIVWWTVVMTPAAAQSITLRVELEQREFFEGQPIYAGLRLANLTPDTVFVPLFEIESGDLKLKITRANGERVRELVATVDYWTLSTWRGVPIPPSGILFETQVLQNRFGDATPTKYWVFYRHLPPGTYRLSASFSLARLHPGARPIESASVDFVVRSRTRAEEAHFSTIERISASRGPQNGAKYFEALLAWVEERSVAAPSDPFLAFMLNQGMQRAQFAGGITSHGMARITELREQFVTTQSRSLGAAVVMEAIAATTPQRLQPLTDGLPPGPAKDVGVHQLRLRPAGLKERR